MRVSDLCVCDVSACSRETSLARAGAQMRKSDVGCLPVVDRQDRVIGMVTDRDIALELTRRNAPPSEIYVDEIMSDRIAVCSTDDDVRDALRLMARNEVRRLPVVDERDRLQGIISIDDIVCSAAQDGDNRQLPYSEVIDTFCQITSSYQAETHSGARSKGRRYRYREESPRFEPEESGRSRREKTAALPEESPRFESETPGRSRRVRTASR
jgi:CBS domain-containing protein